MDVPFNIADLGALVWLILAAVSVVAGKVLGWVFQSFPAASILGFKSSEVEVEIMGKLEAEKMIEAVDRNTIAVRQNAAEMHEANRSLRILQADLQDLTRDIRNNRS